MRECYRCSGEECAADFDELDTCWTPHLCYTLTETSPFAQNDSREVLVFKRDCEFQQMAPIGFSVCEQYRRTPFKKMHYDCCSDDKCNNGNFYLDIHLENPYVKPIFTPIEQYTDLQIIGSIILLVIITSIFGYLIYRRIKKPSNKKNKDLEAGTSNYNGTTTTSTKPKQKATNLSATVITEGYGDLSSHVSSVRFAVRTVAKDIVIGEKIGSGAYGVVYKAKFHWDTVAVKVFPSHDKASYEHEKNIYAECLKSNISQFILLYIESDLSSKNIYLENWIITEYCELGSLYDYLLANTLTLEDARLIIYSILAGFNFLHTFSSRSKPAIAHRDIKSKNILMKSENHCLIADFGLAITKFRNESFIAPADSKIGTKRYMAPELLEETINTTRFQSYLEADVYSIALVLWEVIHRVKLPECTPTSDFRIAYEGMVHENPTFDEMRDVVVTKNLRPPIDPALSRNVFLQTMANMIQMAWSDTPSARPTVLKMFGIIQEFGSFP